MVGRPRDGDHLDGLPLEDIAEVVWTLDGASTPVTFEEDDGDFEPKRLNYPVRNLAPGWHEFSFKASDKGGRWSPGVSVNIFVAEQLHRIYLPIAFPQTGE